MNNSLYPAAFLIIQLLLTASVIFTDTWKTPITDEEIRTAIEIQNNQ